MKKLILLSLALLAASLAVAQTQEGFVKTKGRMVNGQLVPGQGLPGATVNIQGGSSVGVRNADGSFSFVVPARTFMVQSVQKKGYELVDPDITTRPHQQSGNALYLVMETPDQQMEDQLEAEEKISRTLREQLTRARREITRLKEENKITEEEYNQRIAKLMKDQKNNKTLIEEMARQYAQMDYDQMDALNQRISDAILNGRLTEADSLLRSKGDMRSRIAEIRREQQAEAQREAELAQEQQNLDASKAGTLKKVEDAAADCYRFFDNFKLANQYDSAAYYIELRAELDTTNARWQYNAGYYLYDQKQYEKACSYFEKTLAIYRRLAEAKPQIRETILDATLRAVAIKYRIIKRFAESEMMYKESLEINRRLAETNPQTYEPNVARNLRNLASLYCETQRFAEGEEMCIEALTIYRRLAKANPKAYEPDVAMTLDNLASLYSDIQRFTESEELYREALEIFCRLAEMNPQDFEYFVASTLNNLAILYKSTQRFSESEALYREALEICRRLAEANPQVYESVVAQTQYNIGLLKVSMEQYEEAISPFEEALEIFRRLSKVNPSQHIWHVNSLDLLSRLYASCKKREKAYQTNEELLPLIKEDYATDPEQYKSDYAGILGSQSFYCIFLKQFAQAEQYAREGLQVDSTRHFIYANLAASLLFQGKYEEAEQIYRQYKEELKDSFLDDFRQFAEAGVIPKEHEAEVERIKQMLEE